MQHNEPMKPNIAGWLESRTGDTRRQMALKLGWTPSTFNRNIGAPELIIDVCRFYGLNPLEGLIEAGVVETKWVSQLATHSNLRQISERDLLQEIMRRVEERERMASAARPILFPDYSKMSAADAKDYGLAAKKRDSNIGDEDLPDQP